ncbi:MAG TPA: GNAT family N-acetyltransferase [Symbiobacteriaceae bacterium]|nr:GNAT family N-acetyltransferase [Symbiobacteriaceae bacterium]
MQPGPSPGMAQTDRERAMIMERVIMAVRRLWFRAELIPRGCATAVVEEGGELLMCIDDDGDRLTDLLPRAARRGALVMATSLSRPEDLSDRLIRAGFAPGQQQGAYVLDVDAYRSYKPPVPRAAGKGQGLWGYLRRPAPFQVEVEVEAIGEADLPGWNHVCWRAFDPRMSETASLREKQHAFRTMGSRARWYMATAGGRPVGTAILYQEREAAQVLAVGTLPGYRGRGVATAVMRQLIGDWLQNPEGFLFLDTTMGSAAERLYLGMGFRLVYTRQLFAPGGPAS